MRLRSVAILSALSVLPILAHADPLTGSTVDLTYHYPNFATVTYDAGIQTISPGLTDTDSGDGVSVLFGANTITIQNLVPLSFEATAFNGLNLAFLSGPAITSVTFDPSSSAAFQAGSQLAYTASNIRLNLAGTCDSCNGGETIVLDVKAAAQPVAVTPEPSTLALLGTGLLGAAGALRRRFFC